jgi:hypothetical protein
MHYRSNADASCSALRVFCSSLSRVLRLFFVCARLPPDAPCSCIAREPSSGSTNLRLGGVPRLGKSQPCRWPSRRSARGRPWPPGPKECRRPPQSPPRDGVPVRPQAPAVDRCDPLPNDSRSRRFSPRCNLPPSTPAGTCVDDPSTDQAMLAEEPKHRHRRLLRARRERGPLTAAPPSSIICLPASPGAEAREPRRAHRGFHEAQAAALYHQMEAHSLACI